MSLFIPCLSLSHFFLNPIMSHMQIVKALGGGGALEHPPIPRARLEDSRESCWLQLCTGSVTACSQPPLSLPPPQPPASPCFSLLPALARVNRSHQTVIWRVSYGPPFSASKLIQGSVPLSDTHAEPSATEKGVSVDHPSGCFSVFTPSRPPPPGLLTVTPSPTLGGSPAPTPQSPLHSLSAGSWVTSLPQPLPCDSWTWQGGHHRPVPAAVLAPPPETRTSSWPLCLWGAHFRPPAAFCHLRPPGRNPDPVALPSSSSKATIPSVLSWCLGPAPGLSFQ